MEDEPSCLGGNETRFWVNRENETDFKYVFLASQGVLDCETGIPEDMVMCTLMIPYHLVLPLLLAMLMLKMREIYVYWGHS
jgi:hypothetical protein